MKIAVLLSGQPRFINGRGYKTIKEKILDEYNCDIFCHFWWNPGGGSYITAPWSTLGDLPIPKNTDREIETLYRPKKMKWDLPVDPTTTKKIYTRSYHPSSSYNIPSMYLSMLKSQQLMEDYVNETGTTYDFVIRLRYDGILTTFPNLNNLAGDVFYTVDYSKFHNNIANNGCIMTYIISKKFMRIYNSIDKLYNDGIIFNDENLVTAYIQQEKIPYKILPISQFYIDLDRVKIGIDVGGVIIEKDGKSNKDTSFDKQKVYFVDDALSTIKFLSENFDLYIISYCGKTREKTTREVLKNYNVAIPEINWYFTRSRANKGPVCKNLMLDFYIDDTKEVTEIVSNSCSTCQIFWFRGREGLPTNKKITVINNWKEIKNYFTNISNDESSYNL